MTTPAPDSSTIFDGVAGSYVPRGHGPLHSVTERVAARYQNGATDRWGKRMSAFFRLQARNREGTLTEAERKEYETLRALAEEATGIMSRVQGRILDALMHGDLVAREQRPDGNLVDLPAAPWRTKAGQDTLRFRARQHDCPFTGALFLDLAAVDRLFAKRHDGRQGVSRTTADKLAHGEDARLAPRLPEQTRDDGSSQSRAARLLEARVRSRMGAGGAGQWGCRVERARPQTEAPNQNAKIIVA